MLAQDQRLRVYHRRVRWILVALEGVFALIAWSGTQVSDTAAAPTLAQRIAWGSILSATVVLMWRTARLAVVLRDRGVIVRNLFRTHRLGWQDVRAVDPAPPYGALRKAGMQFRLAGGDVVSASAFTRGPLDAPSVGDDLVDAVRSRLASGDRLDHGDATQDGRP